MIAIPHKHNNIVKKLLAHHANPNLQIRGISALQIAAENGSPGIAKILLNNGGDINIWDKKSRTPLMHAADLNEIEIVKILLNNGAKLFALNNNDQTVLNIAEKKKNSESLPAMAAWFKQLGTERL